MIEIIRNPSKPTKPITRCIETIPFHSGKAYAICDGDKIVKWLFFVTEKGELQRF